MAPDTHGWRVYYGDGTTASSAECAVVDLPRRNVQAVIQLNENGWRVVRMYDFYVWSDGAGWAGVDIFGLWDYLTVPRETCVVLFGRTIGEVDYQRVVQRALADATLPPKVAYHRGERRHDEVGTGPGR